MIIDKKYHAVYLVMKDRLTLLADEALDALLSAETDEEIISANKMHDRIEKFRSTTLYRLREELKKIED
jgi:hypothetical protein